MDSMHTDTNSTPLNSTTLPPSAPVSFIEKASARASEKIEYATSLVGETIDHATSVVGENLGEGADRILSGSEAIGTRVQSAADYLKDVDARSLTQDLKDLVRNHPAASVAAGLGVGYLLSRLLRR